MRPRDLLLLYLVTGGVFFAIDLLWLGVSAKDFYARHLGGLLNDRVNWTAALLFYGIYIGGILVFVLVPAIQHGTVSSAAVMGALLGLFAYATFNLTNLALVRGWPWIVAVIDILWGMVLTGSVSAISVWIGKKIM